MDNVARSSHDHDPQASILSLTQGMVKFAGSTDNQSDSQQERSVGDNLPVASKRQQSRMELQAVESARCERHESSESVVADGDACMMQSQGAVVETTAMSENQSSKQCNEQAVQTSRRIIAERTQAVQTDTFPIPWIDCGKSEDDNAIDPTELNDDSLVELAETVLTEEETVQQVQAQVSDMNARVATVQAVIELSRRMGIDVSTAILKQSLKSIRTADPHNSSWHKMHKELIALRRNYQGALQLVAVRDDQIEEMKAEVCPVILISTTHAVCSWCSQDLK